jgi:hypothetical protein
LCSYRMVDYDCSYFFCLKYSAMVISSSDSEELSIRSEGIRGVLLAGYKGCEDFAIYGVYYDAYD